MGLKVCTTKECPNSRETPLSMQEVLNLPLYSYCVTCIENGFDYIYSNNSLYSLDGQAVDTDREHKDAPVEESLLLQKIKRRGLSKKGVPFFGVFTTKEYMPSESIGFIGGALTNATVYKAEEVQERPLLGNSRCFVFREAGRIIDSRRIGNITRFIRRSCRPNVRIAFEAPEEEWQTCPPLKKDPTGLLPLRAKLYAISRIHHTAELFLGIANSALPDEKWVNDGPSIPLSHLLSKCSCLSGLCCLFGKPPSPVRSLPRVLERSRVSSLLGQMHSYAAMLPPLSINSLLSVLDRRCAFVYTERKMPNRE